MDIPFISNLAGPDMILIILIVLLLFGAKKLPGLGKGMNQAMREFLKIRDEEEHETMPHRVALPPHLATPPFISKLAAPLILILVVVLLLFAVQHAP